MSVVFIVDVSHQEGSPQFASCRCDDLYRDVEIVDFGESCWVVMEISHWALRVSW